MLSGASCCVADPSLQTVDPDAILTVSILLGQKDTDFLAQILSTERSVECKR